MRLQAEAPEQAMTGRANTIVMTTPVSRFRPDRRDGRGQPREAGVRFRGELRPRQIHLAALAAMLGGLLIGLIETFWSAYFSIEYKDVAAFSVLIIVLIFLPTGILGRPEVEKV